MHSHTLKTKKVFKSLHALLIKVIQFCNKLFLTLINMFVLYFVLQGAILHPQRLSEKISSKAAFSYSTFED